MNTTLKEQVKALWRLCFSDSDDFIDMYFDYRYTDDINMAIIQDDKVISSLQLIPYNMTFHGKLIPTSYISGACTHPGFQGKGIMRELLKRSFDRMSKTGVLISTLIPAEEWLVGYYAKTGYASVFYNSNELILFTDMPDIPDLSILETDTFNSEMYDYLNRHMMGRDFCIQHSEKDFRVVLADMKLSGGKIVYVVCNNTIEGLAIATPEPGYICLQEMFTDNPDIENAIINYLYRSDGNQIRRISPVNGDNAPDRKLLGMARIINVKEVVSMYAQANPGLETNFEVIDEYLADNNGCYFINGGNCRFDPGNRGNGIKVYTISDLTEMVLGSKNAYMSLMLN